MPLRVLLSVAPSTVLIFVAYEATTIGSAGQTSSNVIFSQGRDSLSNDLCSSDLRAMSKLKREFDGGC
jgi:hypothetical protein